MRNRRLFRHLVLAVVVKLALLAGLWWAFVRDARVSLDGTAVAGHLLASPDGDAASSRGGSR